eukprot:9248793-Pyramimonas_sp.AAC.1
MEYTTQERELQEMVQGPDESWRRDHGSQAAVVCPLELPEDVPEVAKVHMAMADQVRKSPEAKLVADAPNRL